MATQKELLEAIQENGIAIADVHTAVNAIAPTIIAALEAAKQGTASGAQLNEAIWLLNSNTKKLASAKDAVLQLIPTVVSPATQTPVGDTTPITPTPLPDSIDDIVINPSPVGLPGTVSIDVED